jgi:hypothetical protein
LPLSLYSLHTAVVMVKPGGTRNPSFDICDRITGRI